MKFNQVELDLLKQAILYYGGKYGLSGVPEYDRLLNKISIVQRGPASLKRITHEADQTWPERQKESTVAGN